LYGRLGRAAEREWTESRLTVEFLATLLEGKEFGMRDSRGKENGTEEKRTKGTTGRKRWGKGEKGGMRGRKGT